MKSRTRSRLIRFSLAMLGLLIVAPILAGSFQIGDRDGPVFYPESIHSPLYIIAHESAGEGKPRMSPTWVLYNRPLFWGLPRWPKSEAAREELIQGIRSRHGTESPWLKYILEEEQRIKSGQP